MTECTHCRKRYDDSVRFCPVDGFAVAPVAEPWVGRLLMGQFQIQSVCGHGATGTVYRAVQAGMERAVAVKVLRADLLKDPDIVRRFVREARAGAKLNHQNIATVHLVGQTDDGVPFIVMEYVEGLALASVLAVGKPLPLGRIAHIGAQIASALSEAHSQGIVHRDLKPENILLTERRGENDVVKVVDFGIAKMIAHAAPGEDPISRMGTVFGTPHYIAPEQASGQAVDGRADIYSLGCILYQMATGHVPFEGQAGLQVLLSQVRDSVPDPRQLNPRLADPLAELILRTLAKSPAERPATAEHVGQALEQIASGRPTAAPPTTARAPKTEPPAAAPPSEPPELEPEHAAFFGANVRPAVPRSGRDPNRRPPQSGSARGRQSGRRSNHEREHGHDDPMPRRARAEAPDADALEAAEHAEREDRSDRSDRNDRDRSDRDRDRDRNDRDRDRNDRDRNDRDRNDRDRGDRTERVDRPRLGRRHERSRRGEDSRGTPVPFLRRHWVPLLGVGGAVTIGLLVGLLYAQWAGHPPPPAPPPPTIGAALPPPGVPTRSVASGRPSVPLVKAAAPASAAKKPTPDGTELRPADAANPAAGPAAPRLVPPAGIAPVPAGTVPGPLPVLAPIQPSPPALLPTAAPVLQPAPVAAVPVPVPTPAPAVVPAPAPPAKPEAASPPPEKPAASPAPEKPAAGEKPAAIEKPAAEKPAAEKPAEKPASDEPEEPSSDPYHRLK